MKKYHFESKAQLIRCEHIKDKFIGSVGCVEYCEFCSEYKCEYDSWGDGTYDFICTINARKEKLKKINDLC